MGYGHQRAAYPFRKIAIDGIVTANSAPVVSHRERRQWFRFRATYESVSRLSGLPLVGKWFWRLYDRFQRIAKRYPMRDLSSPTMTTSMLGRVLGNGFGSSVVLHAQKHPPVPFLTSFFVPALAADKAGIEKVFCLITDTDCHRVWVANKPRESRIIYCAPTLASRRRLLAYGVPETNVHLTGFPLPEENTDHVRTDLRSRLERLDPQRVFYPRLREVIIREVGELGRPTGTPTITFAVGGAGAQKEVAAQILKSASSFIKDGQLKLNLIAGIRPEVANYFRRQIAALSLENYVDRGVRILFAPNMTEYFRVFNLWLRDTDILWTKPSELVFYAALGIPLVMTEPLGAHEELNRDWIREMGAGFNQEDPRYAGEWLTEWASCGMLAQAAFDGFLKAPRHGTSNVRRLMFAPDRHAVELEFNEACFSPAQLRSGMRKRRRRRRFRSARRPAAADG
jgi:hypothetical protein